MFLQLFGCEQGLQRAKLFGQRQLIVKAVDRFVTVAADPDAAVELFPCVGFLESWARMNFTRYQVVESKADFSLAELALGRFVA